MSWEREYKDLLVKYEKAVTLAKEYSVLTKEQNVLLDEQTIVLEMQAKDMQAMADRIHKMTTKMILDKPKPYKWFWQK